MSDFSKVVFQVCSFIHSVAPVTLRRRCEQRNYVTRALAIVMNAKYDERMHDDVLKTTSRSKHIYILYIY